MSTATVVDGPIPVSKDSSPNTKKSSRRPSSAEQGPSLREEAKALFRAGVMRAAEDVFAEKGFHNARIQDIAERARVAVGTVYNYFKEKDDILLAVLEEHGEAVFQQMALLPSDPPDYEGSLRARFNRTLMHLAEHRNFMQVAVDNGLFGLPENYKPSVGLVALGSLSCHRKRHTELMMAMLKEGIDCGFFANHDLAFLHRFFFGATTAVLAGALCDPKCDPVAEGNKAIDLFLRAAKASP